MGKRYYCDFCDKTMVATPSVIKTHNKGLGHQKMVQDHYMQFKDPETILNEESKKIPCSRFPTGNCSFGSICRFSHYSREEIEEIRRYVAAKNSSKYDVSQPSFEDLYLKLQDKKSKQSIDTDNTVVYDKNGVTHVFPWTYNPIFDSFGDSLPPSLKRLKIEDFVLLITYGYCDTEYNNLEVQALVDTLKNDRHLKSFQFYPVKIYLNSGNNNEANPEPDINLDDTLNVILRSPSSPSDMNFAKDKIQKSKTGKLLRYQHRKKMEELIEFMRERYSSTNYFYNEMKRIKSQYTIKDKMREMLDYCENPANYKIKEKILKYFEKHKKKHEKSINIWNQPTNDLVINVLKDPYNDGVAY